MEICSHQIQIWTRRGRANGEDWLEDERKKERWKKDKTDKIRQERNRGLERP